MFRLFGRAWSWRKVRREFLKEHPVCAVCGTKEKLNIHHKLPYKIYPELELNKRNLITLCRRDHFIFGHLCNWNKFNLYIEIDCDIWHKKINQ